MNWVLGVGDAESMFAAGLAATQNMVCGPVHSKISGGGGGGG